MLTRGWDRKEKYEDLDCLLVVSGFNSYDNLDFLQWVPVLMEKLLTTKEVSKLLGSNDPKGRYVRELWKNGYIEGAKIGRTLMFKAESVQEFIDYQFRLQQFK